ncbi:supervillin isoform X3 [Leptinotarsa decemlineata]
MNSTDEITVFKDPNDLYNSPTLTRRTLGYSYDFPEKSQKKEKKWSFTNMFRRKKKDESDSSSEEECQKKGFLNRRKKKPDSKRKKPIKSVGTFDHVVIPPVPRNSIIYNGYNCHEENAVLSDPTGGFSNYIRRNLPQVPSSGSCQKVSRESLNDSNLSRNSLVSGSIDSVKKTRREQAKARAEARMTSSRNGSSSDDDSHMSNSSLKVRSEEDLKLKDGSSNRKSRAARTERYFKRHSRDGENPFNYLRLSKSDVEHSSMNWKVSDESNRSPSRSPLVPTTPIDARHKLSFSSLHSQNSNISGLSTIPPSHNSQTKYRVSNSTSNPSYKPPQSMNDYNNSTRKQIDLNGDKRLNDQRSYSYDANIHKAPSTDVLHVQFPIMRPKVGHRNLSLLDTSQFGTNRQPPPPPPRDPNRTIGNHYFESGRPNTFYFDNSGQTKSKSFSNSNPTPVLKQTKKFSSFNLHPSFRSTSEDHLPRDTISVYLADRPSSTTPDANKPQRYITRREEVKPNNIGYNYLTDKNPRSRKPIFIKPEDKSTSNVDCNSEAGQKALDFWKQIDRQNINKPILKKTRSDSPQMFTSHTSVQTKVFLPSVLQNDKSKLNETRSPSPFKPATPTLQEVAKTRVESPQTPLSQEDTNRKSTNLEEALDELEAIYNSLRLGDEDLLERAEQREKEAQNRRVPADIMSSYPSFTSRGAMSDSSFSYEPFDSVDSPRRRRMMKKNHTLDIRNDDMAFRKINKERANTIADPQSALSKVSYLLSSPVHKALRDEEDETQHAHTDEPDITFDDVVYRNVKHTNNLLKVADPQPPFGIPLGPITPGANSDYLHAKPENIYRPSFKPRKIPDIVKDDLAFRNLRKDGNKGPALPPLSVDDFKNNNSENLASLKKMRAQRSLSANIGALIHNDTLERVRQKRNQNNDVENEFKTLTDIADAMEIARNVLRDKENKISTTRKAFMSDTDTKYVQPVTNTSSLRESRQNFLNGLKNSVDKSTQISKPCSPRIGEINLSAKPPRGLTPESRRSPKESTPIPISPLQTKSESSSSSLDDLLSALAEEAKETTERITKELNLLNEEKETKSIPEQHQIGKGTEAEVDKKLSEIDAVSEHAKLCEKLLECVVDSTELMASTKNDLEVVEQINFEPEEERSANVVVSRIDSKEEDRNNETGDSEHDYENLLSDKELNVDEVDVTTSLQEIDEQEKCRSPFEEHKSELIASFQELRNNMADIEMPGKKSDEEINSEKKSSSKVDSGYENLELIEQGVTDNRSTRRSRSRLPKWLWFHSVGSQLDQPTNMSESQEKRADRIARYKEERRRQLAAQFGTSQETSTVKATGKDGGTSSSSEGPRPTRASRLRLAALSSQEGNSSSQFVGSRSLNPEKSPTSPLIGNDSRTVLGSKRVERDKSNKRKSNLNRSLTSEEVPPAESSDDLKNRRRRRRFFPPEILDLSIKESSNENDPTIANITASIQSTSPVLSVTASSPSPKTTPRKSELSLHMENARRGITPAFSEMGKYKPFAKRAVTSSPKPSSPRYVDSSQGSFFSKTTNATKESRSTVSDDDKNKGIANRMEELSALTKQTLARVERLTSKSRESPKKDVRRPVTSSPSKQPDHRTGKERRKPIFPEKAPPSSILKKKSSVEEPPSIIVESIPPLALSGPVSILKRKVSQDDHSKHEGIVHSSTSTPPVTFSPSVVEPSTTKRKQGILKKRRSLDESTVMRHRSCSPDVAHKKDSRSILKNQRRSSLEELRRTQSPEIHLHSILKRKSSRTEDEDHSLNSPQSILKRRSGASSAGSTGSSPHVSITTAVILAAAGGAEMVLDPEPEPVKPILKKRSFSEEHTYHSDALTDVPKPILKKKSSTDTEDSEEKPKPILKLPKTAEREFSDGSIDNPFLKHTTSSETECEVRPILKQTSREESPRPRLSFCSEDTDIQEEVVRNRTSRRSHTICTDFNIGSSNSISREEDRLMTKPRPLSVHDLVLSFESSSSTGAIPKRSSLKRSSDRYKTQPVTSNEFEASRYLLKSPQFIEDHPTNQSNLSSNSPNFDVRSLLDFTTSLENDSNLNSFFSSSLHNPSSSENFSCGKMSSDSAFQSLGDGLELEQEEDGTPQDVEMQASKAKSKLEPSKLELQMKAIAEEAKKMKLGKGNTGIEKYRLRKTGVVDKSPRFSTQPVTFEEVQEASRINESAMDNSGAEEADPSNLSLEERIKLFNFKDISSRKSSSPLVSRGYKGRARFSTELVNADHVSMARDLFLRPTAALDDIESEKSSEMKSILKSAQTTGPKSPVSPFAPKSSVSPFAPKSVLKKRDSFNSSLNRRSILLKVETSPDKDDEGISCNSVSGSESDSSIGGKESVVDNKKTASKKTGKFNGDSTSEGESSGGREIRSIFRNDDKLRVKQALENVLSKSRSQGTFSDDFSLLPPKKTVTVRRSHTQNEMPQAIADLRAKLQERGESDWRKRVPFNNNATDELKLLKEKNRYNDELSEKSLLAAKKDELDASARQWKTRVEKSDAEKFSVAGKMGEKFRDAVPTINIPMADENKKRTPQPKRFKLKDGPDSTPTSPEKNSYFDLTRSKSVPFPPIANSDLSGSPSPTKLSGRKVSVHNPDDVTFQSFFKSVEKSSNMEHIVLSSEDLDAVQRHSLLVTKKNIQVQRRRGATKNPIKALATRSDISNEYTEVITGVAEREKKRLNIEKLAKNSNKALEVLAGLASNEDFKSVALKKASGPTGYLPWKDLMLLQIKGRRHVQTRLVEPVASSINEGDNYILITPQALYTYTGTYSNVIEQSRLVDVANHIRKTGDMNCKVEKIYSITANNASQKNAINFWRLLGADEAPVTIPPGHYDEDETYESNILHTNMIYTLEDDELVPYEKFWGTIPKIEMLKDTSIIVFDFGSEMYVWSGKNAPLDKKRLSLKLAKDLWEEGYNYSECNICPLNIASILGERKSNDLQLKAPKRPEWALFAKVTQHRETVLFREKFLDWPDFSRVIQVKNDEIKEVNATIDLRPCDINEMLKEKDPNPDLVVENIHLGRGDQYFDEETRRLFDYETLTIQGWRILENTYEELKEKSIGQFFEGDSYIYSWNYRQTTRGRELNGKPSKHAAVGRDRCVFFCWQGSESSINEKGMAALLTVELDKQNAPQVRVVQGSEPAAFLRLFDGNMIIHRGKRDEADDTERPRLFMVRGEKENEIYLMEVPLSMSSLRSRSSFVIVDTNNEQVTIWHGAKSSKQKKKVIEETVKKLMVKKPVEMQLDVFEEDLDIVNMEEGSESEDFFDVLGNNRESYLSLLNSTEKYDHTIRLFRMSSVTGHFDATELLCPHRSEHSSPYPFVQSELYSASQPALFLIDNHHELWLWQGYWPEKEDDVDLSDQTGSGAVRWQAERRAAMQTAKDYWKKSKGDDIPLVAYLVWAGLEPLRFKNLFPTWKDQEDIAELNIKEGKKSGDMLPLEKELALLSRTTYPLSDLVQRPLPEGVDPTNIEKYLSKEDFQELLSMSKDEFEKLPSWKKTALKKEKGLF